MRNFYEIILDDAHKIALSDLAYMKMKKSVEKNLITIVAILWLKTKVSTDEVHSTQFWASTIHTTIYRQSMTTGEAEFTPYVVQSSKAN